jgi:hypothetical protein
MNCLDGRLRHHRERYRRITLRPTDLRPACPVSWIADQTADIASSRHRSNRSAADLGRRRQFSGARRTPVKVDAGNFADLFLIKHCVRGAASAEQDGDTAEWQQGQTMILSAGRETELQFDHTFQQRSVRLDISRLEATCARWLGYPLEQPLQFTLRSFSDEMERIWQSFAVRARTPMLRRSPRGMALRTWAALAPIINLRLESFPARRCDGDASDPNGISACPGEVDPVRQGEPLFADKDMRKT